MSIHNVSKHPISHSNQKQSFKLKELEMKLENDALKIRLKATLLKAHNYAITLENNILNLRVMTEKKYVNTGQIIKVPVFVESFLSIPNPDYNRLVDSYFLDDCLHVTIGKTVKEEMFATRSAIA